MSKKVVKKKVAATKRFYATRLYPKGEIFIYQSVGKPHAEPTDFVVRGPGGNVLHAIMELCNAVNPLFVDVKVGEVREVKVTLE